MKFGYNFSEAGWFGVIFPVTSQMYIRMFPLQLNHKFGRNIRPLQSGLASEVWL